MLLPTDLWPWWLLPFAKPGTHFRTLVLLNHLLRSGTAPGDLQALRRFVLLDHFLPPLRLLRHRTLLHFRLHLHNTFDRRCIPPPACLTHDNASSGQQILLPASTSPDSVHDPEPFRPLREADILPGDRAHHNAHASGAR